MKSNLNPSKDFISLRLNERKMSNILKETLSKQPLICAEGYLFEMERRGYLTSGEFVPEVALEYPEVLENLHKEFQHAGSNVVQAFTYNGHREKMRVINKEHLLEPLNRAALKIARKCADNPPKGFRSKFNGREYF